MACAAHDYTADVRDRAKAALAAVAELVEAVRDVYGDDCEQVCETSCPTCRIRRALAKFGGAACTLRDARPAPQQPAAVAPVGVDEVVRKVCERLDKVADYAHTIDGETVVVALSNLPAVLARALSEALAQQPAAEDEVVFIDGVGAGRSSVKSCHDGVQWIRVGDRVYWPLSDSDAKRLQSACCGKGSFDGPAMPAS